MTGAPMPNLGLVVLAVCFLICPQLPASQEFDIAPIPSWVDQTDVRALLTGKGEHDGSGSIFWLSEEQVAVAQEVHFNHFVRQIHSQGGLQRETELIFEFNPSYQSLVLHHIRLWRGGKQLNRLDVNKINVIQREPNLENNLYDGRRSAILILEDLRVGDVIDYAYSIKGFNPVFGGRFMGSFGVQWHQPVARVKYRILVPDSRRLLFKAQNTNLQPTIGKRNGLTEYLIELSNVERLVLEPQLPVWYNPYARIQVSEFASWREVAKWADELFKVGSRPSKEIRDIVWEIIKGQASDEERVAAALRFVQDEIRYIGLELGQGAYKPTDPNIVCNRRFGDCKDKSLLFCTMLDLLDINSTPALVNTYARHTIESFLPSAHAFNHVIVNVQIDGIDYWLDPTISLQRGDLDDIAPPNHSRALLISATADSLTHIRQRHVDHSRIEMTESFYVRESGEPATLLVKTDYYGRNADYMRSYLAVMGKTEFKQSQLNYYGQQYPSLAAVDPFDIEDDEAANHIVITEEYRIPDFWQFSEDSSKRSCQLYAQAVAGLLAAPPTANRKMPLGVEHPTHLTLLVEATMPRDWTVPEQHVKIEDKAFDFECKTIVNANKITAFYGYSTKMDWLLAEEAAAHSFNMSKAANLVGLELYDSVLVSDKPTTLSMFFIATALVIGVVVVSRGVLNVKAARTRAAETEEVILDVYSDDYSRIGGPLILVAIGLVITPFFQISTLLTNFLPVLSEGAWANLTTAGSEFYDALWAPLIIFELLGYLALLILAIVTTIYFFGRCRSAVKLLIFFYVGNLLFLLVDSVLASQLTGMAAEAIPDSTAGIVQAVVTCAVWIPYLKVSRRVRGTFIY